MGFPTTSAIRRERGHVHCQAHQWTPTVNEEASEVWWVAPVDLDRFDIHPTMRRQLNDYLNKRYPVID